MKEMQEGKYLTRTSWTDGSYLVLLPQMQYVWKIAIQPNPAAGNWLPLVVDILADDWITQSELLAAVNDPIIADQIAA